VTGERGAGALVAAGATWAVRTLDVPGAMARWDATTANAASPNVVNAPSTTMITLIAILHRICNPTRPDPE